MSNLLFNIYQFFQKRKSIFWIVLLSVFFIPLFFILRLQFNEDITRLLPQDEESQKIQKIINNTNFSDNIIVLITGNDNDTLVKNAQSFIDTIQSSFPDEIEDIKGLVSDKTQKVFMDFIYDNLPLFLDEVDYHQLKDKISSEEEIKEIIEANFKAFISPGSIVTKNYIRKDPLGMGGMASEKFKSLMLFDNFQVYNGFLVDKKNKALLLFVKTKIPVYDTDLNNRFVNSLYDYASDLNHVSIDYYGATVVSKSNADRIKSDISLTVTIAFTLLLLLLITFYRKILTPIILFVPTILGGGIALLFLFIYRESISSISLGIGSVLLGITIDYSLHVLTHFDKSNDVKQLYKDVTKPILMSAVTTAIAFLCLFFIKSQALQDLGIFTAISVLCSAIIALIVIPILFKSSNKEDKGTKKLMYKIAGYAFYQNRFVILAIVVLAIGSCFYFSEARFNEDLEKMNYQNDLVLRAKIRLDSLVDFSSKSVYVVSYGENSDEVLESNSKVALKLESLKNSGLLNDYSSNGSIVYSKADQDKRITEWNTFWGDTVKRDLKEALIADGRQFGFNESTYSPFYNVLDKEYYSLDYFSEKELKNILGMDFLNFDSELKTAVSSVKLSEENITKLEQELKEIPNVVVIDRKAINEGFLKQLEANFSDLINYSFIAIVLILLLFYRNVELTLFTIFPIALTWFLTLGIMGAFDIEFTIFNVIISTFIFGLGVDYSIFLTNGLIKDYTYGTNEIKVYKTSILLSVLTTILGVGILIFAQHPALFSISILCIIGIVLTLGITFTIQPLVFKIFVSMKAQKGFSPIRFVPFINSLFSLTVYATTGLLASLVTAILVPLIPVNKLKKQKALLQLVAWSVQLTLYTNPFVRKRVLNPHGEDFKKPSIIIANHSSSLDTLALGLLTPNVIYFVNDWVYKSPVFGKLVRYLEFFRVSNGVENSIESIKKKVDQGFSVVIFPEGKRALTNKMGRFHKGAFYLQKELGIDILPIYIHGNSEVMPKGDFIINNGKITLEVGERITAASIEGVDVRELTKRISKEYKSNFNEFRHRVESKDYYKRLLYANYLFKEGSFLKEVKKDFQTHIDTYKFLTDYISGTDNIVHLANDFGQIDILMKLKYPEIKLQTILSDKELLNIASQCLTNQVRKTVYLSHNEDLEIKDKSKLLISTNSHQSINDEFLSRFEVIILLKSATELINSFDNYEVLEKKQEFIVLKNQAYGK